MRPFLAIALLAVAGLAHAGAREKITHASLDGDAHPWVGSLCGPGNKGQMYAHCSGVLLSPTVFCTAAHCAWTGHDERTVVCFDSQLENKPNWPSSYYDVKDHGGEKYGMVGGYMRINTDLDMGCVDLDVRQSWPITRHPTLPRLHQFDVQTPQTFTLVGFGIPQDGLDANVYAKFRRVGVSPYRSRTTRSIKIGSSSSSIGCGDDSGAPFFVGSGPTETLVVAGFISVADDGCNDYNYGPRTDSVDFRNWMSQFPSVVLP